jgi:hypothetical protein
VQERKRFPEFRVVAKSQEQLFEEGLETSDDEEIHITVGREGIPSSKATYAGDKWGGKYLRAPDIFYTILEKGKDKLVRLGDIAEVRFGIKTGANEFFYLDDEKIARWGIEKEFLKPVIKSPRECKSILIDPKQLKYKIFMCHQEKKELKGTRALKYIEWGEEQGFHKRPSCAGRERWWDLGSSHTAEIIWSMMHAESHNVYWNNSGVEVDHNFFEIIPVIRDAELFIVTYAVSSIAILIKELFGRAYGGGSGPIKNEGIDIEKYYFLRPDAFERLAELQIKFYHLSMRSFNPVLEECGFEFGIPIRSQRPNPLPDRKALDDVVFDALGLTEAERKEVYWAVCELVQNRLRKAKSV